MFDSILGNLFGNKKEIKKTVSSNVLNRIKRRKLIIQKFKSIDPNDNLKRARVAKKLFSVSRTEGERKAARKFYKDETALNNLKNRIKSSDSINEKLSLARQGKRLATKQQKEFWENLINKLQKRKQARTSATESKKEVLVTTDTSKEQVKEESKDMKVEEKQEQSIEENESGEGSGNDSDNDIEELEEDDNEDGDDEDEEEEEIEEQGEDDNEDIGEEEEEELDGTLGNDTNYKE